jgi:KipI family sensor histidine kinase inhibitor
MHTSRPHIVDLIGFTPGFAYIAGLGDDASVPRLAEPRQRVEPGSVGMAGGLTGLYALAGPGGWPLIGRTPLTLFRPEQSQPLLLDTGTRIRFVAIDEETYRRMAPQ